MCTHNWKKCQSQIFFHNVGSRQSLWFIIFVPKIVCFYVLSLSHYLYLSLLLLSEMPRIFTMQKAKMWLVCGWEKTAKWFQWKADQPSHALGVVKCRSECYQRIQVKFETKPALGAHWPRIIWTHNWKKCQPQIFSYFWMKAGPLVHQFGLKNRL